MDQANEMFVALFSERNTWRCAKKIHLADQEKNLQTIPCPTETETQAYVSGTRHPWYIHTHTPPRKPIEFIKTIKVCRISSKRRNRGHGPTNVGRANSQTPPPPPPTQPLRHKNPAPTVYPRKRYLPDYRGKCHWTRPNNTFIFKLRDTGKK